MQVESPHPFLFVPVNKLAKYPFCPKRAKIELTQHIKYPSAVKGKNPLEIGVQMHSKLSLPYKSFDRKVFMAKLRRQGPVLVRFWQKYAIRGIPDDYIVKSDHTISVVEVKTTTRKQTLEQEKESFKMQLQLYIWILEPLLPKLGYKLAEEHYVEIYSQQTRKQTAMLVVKANSEIESFLQYAFDSFAGLERMVVPPFYVCRHCSKPIKEVCSWYQERRRR